MSPILPKGGVHPMNDLATSPAMAPMASQTNNDHVGIPDYLADELIALPVTAQVGPVESASAAGDSILQFPGFFQTHGTGMPMIDSC
jgi:hypothetical protein